MSPADVARFGGEIGISFIVLFGTFTVANFFMSRIEEGSPWRYEVLFVVVPVAITCLLLYLLYVTGGQIHIMAGLIFGLAFSIESLRRRLWPEIYARW